MFLWSNILLFPPLLTISVSNASKWGIYPRVRYNPGPGCFCLSSRWTDHYPQSSLNNLCNSKLIPAPCFLEFSRSSFLHWSPIQMFLFGWQSTADGKIYSFYSFPLARMTRQDSRPSALEHLGELWT